MIIFLPGWLLGPGRLLGTLKYIVCEYPINKICQITCGQKWNYFNSKYEFPVNVYQWQWEEIGRYVQKNFHEINNKEIHKTLSTWLVAVNKNPWWNKINDWSLTFLEVWPSNAKCKLGKQFEIYHLVLPKSHLFTILGLVESCSASQFSHQKVYESLSYLVTRQ